MPVIGPSYHFSAAGGWRLAAGGWRLAAAPVARRRFHRLSGELPVEMSVTELAGPVTRIRLDGRLDAPGADRIGVRFTASVVSLRRHAIVDMTGISFIASMGIRLLIATARAQNQKGYKMVLFGAPELVQGVLIDTALDQIIPIVASESEALGELAA
jgi:anti-sigma B factor antagonist